jgi:Fe2+ or Zn2+ uptake regulation protein
VDEDQFHLEQVRFAGLLRTAGCKVTPQRLAVLRALAAGPHLGSCREIWKKAQRLCDDLGLVTVYRTLSRLHAVGLVEQVDSAGTAYFGLSNHHHDHVVCQSCGALEPMDTCLLGPLDGIRLPRSDFLVTGHRLDLYGLCRACQAKPRAS